MINYEFQKENELFSKLHYMLMFRQFDAVYNLVKDKSNEEIKNLFLQEGFGEYKWIRPIECAMWNLDYINQYELKNANNIKINDLVKSILDEEKIKKQQPLSSYDQIITENNESAFDIFFKKKQPMLNLKYMKKQTLSAKQLKNNGMSINLSEVGTGKSVSGLYAMADVIELALENNRLAKILIVAPYQLREKWQEDIRRQLGRHAHIVVGGEEDSYLGDYKKVYFRDNEQFIFIAGNTSNSLKENLKKWSANEKWDLIIIDEAHLCFNSYKEMKAEKILLLTATPIVKNSEKIRSFSDYKKLMKDIISPRSNCCEIDPLNNVNPNENDIFVQHFREDLEVPATERDIKFIECERIENFTKIKEFITQEKKDLATLHYMQDDWLLYDKLNELLKNKELETEMNFNKPERPEKNQKIEKLKEILKSNDNKSYIVFCEHQKVVDFIYDELSSSDSNLLVAKKYGDDEMFDEGKCEKGTLIDQLKQRIIAGDKVVLIITGKIGGTGLNLSNFDGIIHYELPYTSIELEQRYGRVDRLDGVSEFNKIKEMIFLVNETKEDENYFEFNKMLDFCTTKINKTCEYMPIRNTVIFHPDMSKKYFDRIISELEILKDGVFKSYNKLKGEEELCIKELQKKMKPEATLEEFKEELVKFLKRDLSKLDDEEIQKYLKIQEDLKTYKDKEETFKKLSKVAKKILVLFGQTEITEDMFYIGEIKPENIKDGLDKEREVISYSENFKIDMEEVNEEDLHIRINKLIGELNKVKNTTINLSKELGSGIFYIKENLIYRRSIEEFRRKANDK